MACGLGNVDGDRACRRVDALGLVAVGITPTLSGALVEAGPQGRTPGGIAETLSLPGATLSFHLKELTAAGLIEGTAHGRNISYRANFGAMNGLVEFLTRNCCGGDQSRCRPTSRPSPKGAKAGEV